MTEQAEPAMSITLPDFRDTCCQHLTACGKIVEPRQIPSVEITGEPLRTAPYFAGGQKAYVRVLTSRDEVDHLHVEIASARHYRRELAAKHTIEDLDTLLRPFLGATIDVSVRGGFVVSLDALPADGLIRSTSLQRKTGEFEMKMTGATFSFEGVPLEGLAWHFQEDEKTASITMHAARTVKIDKQYFLSQLSWIRDLFDTFVLGRAPNVAESQPV